MKLKTAYLGLSVLGAILPYWQLTLWLVHNGPDLRLFVQQLFANRISAFFGVDVLLSAAVLLVFICSEGSRLGLRRLWLPIIAIFAVGVSLGLPLFLYMRETSGPPVLD